MVSCILLYAILSPNYFCTFIPIGVPAAAIYVNYGMGQERVVFWLGKSLTPKQLCECRRYSCEVEAYRLGIRRDARRRVAR